LALPFLVSPALKYHGQAAPTTESLSGPLLELANILVVKLDAEQPRFWFVVGFLCAILAVPVTLTQYVVSEALYGIDGRGGPVGAE